MKRRRVFLSKKKPLCPTLFLTLPKDVWLTCILQRHCNPRTVFYLKQTCKTMNTWLDHDYAIRWITQVFQAKKHTLDSNPWLKLIALDAIARSKNSTRKILLRKLGEREDRLYHCGDMRNVLNCHPDGVVWHFENGYVLWRVE